MIVQVHTIFKSILFYYITKLLKFLKFNYLKMPIILTIINLDSIDTILRPQLASASLCVDKT